MTADRQVDNERVIRALRNHSHIHHLITTEAHTPEDLEDFLATLDEEALGDLVCFQAGQLRRYRDHFFLKTFHPNN